MKFEMARLHSVFARRFGKVAWALRHGRTERGERIKAMFCDVFRHFHCSTVSKRRHSAATPAIAAVAGLAVLAGCAGVGALSPDAPADVKREAVATRAKERWDRLIANDLDGAYGFLSPASRETMPLDLYKAKHKVGMYRSVKVDNVNCDGDTCTVKLSLTYDFKRVKGITTPLTEKWVISKGQAWFVDRG
jgi:hypothetical protein